MQQNPRRQRRNPRPLDGIAVVAALDGQPPVSPGRSRLPSSRRAWRALAQTKEPTTRNLPFHFPFLVLKSLSFSPFFSYQIDNTQTKRKKITTIIIIIIPTTLISCCFFKKTSPQNLSFLSFQSMFALEILLFFCWFFKKELNPALVIFLCSCREGGVSWHCGRDLGG